MRQCSYGRVIQVSTNEKERESIQRIQQITGELFSKSYKDLTEVQIPKPNKTLEIVFNNLPGEQGLSTEAVVTSLFEVEHHDQVDQQRA
ncbi:hypothetical protein PSCICF_39700 [Pseudomonas cichorii]|nr:hypothetical protein PSCICF_39700 [Pseudomonas cichorii]GFM62525.1 hypothetical protein PSCICG_36850 [Pseudomonas cichorii]